LARVALVVGPDIGRYNHIVANENQPAKPRRITRRRLFKTALGLVAGSVGVAAYARWIEPTWLEVVECDLPVAGLPPAWNGVRVALLADLHRSPQVTHEYLAEAIRLTQSLEPDLLAVVGDYSHMGFEYSEDAARLLAGFRAPLGCFSCLGNHDYGLSRWVNTPVNPTPRLVDVLVESGVRVLLNEAVPLVRGGQTLWLAGTEDLWAGRCQPAVAMKNVPAGAANITLCHNPDAIEGLSAAGCGTILSGHTHGGQVDIPFIGPPRLPVIDRNRYRGLHHVGGSWLYINRGLGWLIKVRFLCRPEISLLTLRPAPAT
jgi:uncharacterized protein